MMGFQRLGAKKHRQCEALLGVPLARCLTYGHDALCFYNAFYAAIVNLQRREVVEWFRHQGGGMGPFQGPPPPPPPAHLLVPPRPAPRSFWEGDQATMLGREGGMHVSP